MKLCDKLENCSKNEICYKNKIVCTKAVLQSYINGDENKRLKLKAQIKQYEKGIYVFFASTFWTKLQNIFGHYCKSKLDKVAKPRLAAILPAA